MAYCLLGLFGINMPLLYGEGGPQAFKRLQLAIVEARHDPTLLAWSWPILQARHDPGCISPARWLDERDPQDTCSCLPATPRDPSQPHLRCFLP